MPENTDTPKRRGRPPNPNGATRQMIRTDRVRWEAYGVAARVAGYAGAGAWLSALGDAAIAYEIPGPARIFSDEDLK